jgi:polygalacturonase
VNLIAPETSPNTDGIDISSSTNIIIEHSTISTGSTLNILYHVIYLC